MITEQMVQQFQQQTAPIAMPPAPDFTKYANQAQAPEVSADENLKPFVQEAVQIRHNFDKQADRVRNNPMLSEEGKVETLKKLREQALEQQNASRERAAQSLEIDSKANAVKLQRHREELSVKRRELLRNVPAAHAELMRAKVEALAAPLSNARTPGEADKAGQPLRELMEGSDEIDRHLIREFALLALKPDNYGRHHFLQEADAELATLEDRALRLKQSQSRINDEIDAFRDEAIKRRFNLH